MTWGLIRGGLNLGEGAKSRTYCTKQAIKSKLVGLNDNILDTGRVELQHIVKMAKIKFLTQTSIIP